MVSGSSLLGVNWKCKLTYIKSRRYSKAEGYILSGICIATDGTAHHTDNEFSERIGRSDRVGKHIQIVSRSELPLYMSWKKGLAFERVLKGEQL